MSRGTIMTYDFSAHSKEYERTIGKSHKYFIEGKCSELLKVLAKYGHNPKKVLDLGCGTGEAEQILCKQFDRIVGIDLSEGMIGEAKKKTLDNCEFRQADATRLPFPDQHFDLVLSFALFHHLAENQLEQVISEAARVTRKSGMLLVFEHNPRNPITKLVVERSPIDKGVVLLNASRIEELYRMAKIDILEKRYIVFFPSLLSFLHPLEKFLYKIPYGGQYCVAGLVT